jgi:membrane-associated phospholipid phosphatase
MPWNWGLDLIAQLQHYSPALDSVFRALSFLGEEDFLLLLIPFVYWCLSRSVGAQLALLFTGSTYLNACAKAWIGLPRPFQVDARIKQLTTFSGHGFPSLHTQSSVVVGGFLAQKARRIGLWVIALLLMLLVPLSRLYLGVHFPLDLAGGYLLGLGSWLLFAWLSAPLGRRLGAAPFWQQLILAVLGPGVLVILFPTGEEIGVTAGGMLLGFAVGLVLERRFVQFDVPGPAGQRALRFILGIIIILILRFGLKAAFDTLSPELTWRYIRYVIMGLWAAAGAPWLFLRLRLAQPPGTIPGGPIVTR